MDGVTVTEERRASTRRAPGRRPAARSGSGGGRLTGIDVARGVAVIGMYAAHLGPDPSRGGIGVLFSPFEGRSAALFAVLSGLSIALMSGGRHPKTGVGKTKVAWRLGTRAPLLLALGLWLTNLGTGYLVILAYYGVCFVAAIPFLRLRAKALFILAGVFAVVVPFVSYFVRAAVAPRDLLYMLPDPTFDQIRQIGDLPEVLLSLVLTGAFPALGLMTYVFAGMAIGRLDLTSRLVNRALMLGGTALAVLAYGSSWLATSVFGGMRQIYASLAPAAAQAGITPEQFYAQNSYNIHGTPPTTSLAWELVSSAHAYTPFDFVGCLGVAAAVIGGCQLAGARFGKLLRPFSDLGSVILSAYVFHFIAIYLLWGTLDQNVDPFSLGRFFSFSAVALVGAMAWKKWVGKGPLEWLLHTATRWPDYAFRGRVPAQRSSEPLMDVSAAANKVG
ncbi:DUF418 domain-containing protein [Amycolatopsis minnesotensis]|uniref:Membrane protein YeiB n=1 Tax=Amycolatopsis minnesotensis TaxID=337894 RepID=A0ABN2RJ41_9PSEU